LQLDAYACKCWTVWNMQPACRIYGKHLRVNIDAYMQCRLHADIEMDAVDGLTRASSNIII